MIKYVRVNIEGMDKGSLKIGVDQNCTNLIPVLRELGYTKVYAVPENKDRQAKDHDLTLVHKYLGDNNVKLFITENGRDFKKIKKRGYVIYNIVANIKDLDEKTIGKLLGKYIQVSYSLDKEALVNDIKYNQRPSVKDINLEELRLATKRSAKAKSKK